MEFTLSIDTIIAAITLVVWLARLESVARQNVKRVDELRDSIITIFKTIAEHDKNLATLKLKVSTASDAASRASTEIDKHIEKCDRTTERIWDAIEGNDGLTSKITRLETQMASKGDD